jgi:type II secretory pathway predicted ATPase ExeA
MKSKFDIRLRMGAAGVSIADFARGTGLSRTTAYRLVTDGVWPIRDAGARERVTAFLARLPGGDDSVFDAEIWDDLEQVWNEMGHGLRVGACKKTGAASGRVPRPDIPETTGPENTFAKEHHMLITKCDLTQAARDWWGLPPEALVTPWRREHVFLGGGMRVAYEHMLLKARHGGMLAVVGESGSGKTTLKDLLVTDLAGQGDVIVIEPHTQRMEETDKTGKTLRGGDIVEAIMREIAPAQKLRRTAEAQLNQVAACLGESLDEHRERRHLLIIDEAHSLPKPTLRHLKRFLEMKNPKIKGLQRPMLSIILLGQPELGTRLSPYDQTVREVWQRCETVHLPPVGKALAEYLAFRLGKAAAAFAPDALVKLTEILMGRDGASFLYPLAIDSWAAEILNTSTGLGKTITAAHVAEVRALVEKRLRGRRS